MGGGVEKRFLWLPVPRRWAGRGGTEPGGGGYGGRASRPNLGLPGAAEAERCRAKKSLASLAGCKALSGQGEPPTRSASCVPGGVGRSRPTNKMGEASTASPVGRRGDRAPCSAGTASQRRVADAE